ncbi:hypothetical protein Slin14017_G107480 [Septoria linicola]|nr:hypothetical protein Slin14017_G107480 [Septoria linicola]
MDEPRIQNATDFPFGNFGIEAIHYYAGAYTDAPDDIRDDVAALATDFHNWARMVPLLALPNPDAPARLDPDILIDVLFSCANAHLQTFQSPEQAQPVVDAFVVLVPCILEALQSINDELLGDTMTQRELEEYLFYMIFTRHRMLRDGGEFFSRLILPAIEDGPPPREGLTSAQWFAVELMRYFVRLSTSVHIFYASGSSSVDWRLNVLAMQN